MLRTTLSLVLALGSNAAPTDTASDSLNIHLDAAASDALTSLDAPVSVSLLDVAIDNHNLQILAALVPDAYREDALLLLEEHELDVLDADDAMALLSAGQQECLAAANAKKSAAIEPYRTQSWCSGSCAGDTCAAYCKAYGDADAQFYKDMMACLLPPAKDPACMAKAKSKLAKETPTFGDKRAQNRYKLRVAKC